MTHNILVYQAQLSFLVNKNTLRFFKNPLHCGISDGKFKFALKQGVFIGMGLYAPFIFCAGLGHAKPLIQRSQPRNA
jgi:hypothetical protein